MNRFAKNNLPWISIIIPCRNEEKFIRLCLDSILDQDYPKDEIEILVVDGMSEDGTRSIIKDYVQNYPFIKVLDNSKKVTPFAMNIGIKFAKGDVIMKMDAHTTYKKDYVSNCVKYLDEYKADNVGGILEMIPTDSTVIARAIVLSFSCPFGVGNSYFRTGCQRPKWVDTVAFGCYRREVFEKFGLYNENLTRSQDIELNSRLRKSGGKILLHPNIIGYYYPPSKFTLFIRYNFINGLWAILPFKYTSIMPVSLRHLVPLVFVLGLFGSIAFSLFLGFFWQVFLFVILSYVLANFCFSLQTVMKGKDIRLMFIMPIIFAVLHFSYGLGSVLGLIRCLISRQFWVNRLFKRNVEAVI